MFHSAIRTAITVLGCAMLTACGGGGGDVIIVQKRQKVALPTSSISGVFEGKIDSARPVTNLLLSDGSYFMVYSEATQPQRFIGVVAGSGTLNNGSLASTNGLDLSLLGTGSQTPKSVSLSSSYSEKKTFNGFLTYPETNRTNAFATSYNSSYETLPSLVDLAGVYTGSIATKGVREDKITLTITAEGKLSGRLSCGCTVNAELVVRADKQAYDATLEFDGGTHPLAGTSMAGNVYLDRVSKRLYIVGKLNGTTDSAIFVGVKP